MPALRLARHRPLRVGICVTIGVLLCACGGSTTATPTNGPPPPSRTPRPTLTPLPPLTLPATPTPSRPDVTVSDPAQTPNGSAAADFRFRPTPRPTARLPALKALPVIEERPRVQQLPDAPVLEIREVTLESGLVLMVSVPGQIAYRVQTLGRIKGSARSNYGLTPDGKFVYYIEGNPGTCCAPESLLPGTLALTFVRLIDGNVARRVALTGPDFPRNLLVLAEQEDVQRTFEPQLSPQLRAELMYAAFVAGIGVHSWSPDGRFMAVAAQIEGLSLDVYVLDMLTGAVVPSGDAPGHVQRIAWSPDQRWIVYGESFQAAPGPTAPLTMFAQARESAEVRELGAGWSELTGWLGPNSGVFARIDAPSNTISELTRFDLDAGVLKTVWSTPVRFAQTDLTESLLAFCTAPGRGGQSELWLARAPDYAPRAAGPCPAV